MQSKFKRILFGGDYNPNQWPKEVWEQDMAYFKDAHINSATINVFSWAKIQPSENEYNFTELDEIVDMLSNENYVRTPWYIRSTQRLLRQSLQNAIAAIKIFLYGTSITSTADTVTVTTVRSSFVYGSRISTRLLMP